MKSERQRTSGHAKKYDWHGFGILRFKIEQGDDLWEKTWEESINSRLEEKVDDIANALASAEKTGRENRAEWADRESRKQNDNRWKWRYGAPKSLSSRVENCWSKWPINWRKSGGLRSFIRACEKILRNGKHEIWPDGWEGKWLAWAQI